MGRAASASPPAVRGPEPESLFRARGRPAPAPPRPRPRAAAGGPRDQPGCKQAGQLTRPDLRRHPGYKRATSRTVRSDRVAAAMQTPCLLLLLALGLLAAPAAALVR